MKEQNVLNRELEAIAWGLLFIWWGINEMIPTMPGGAGALGIGLILLGLNAARWLNGFEVSGFTTVVGVLAVVLGGLEMAQGFLHLAVEIPIFAILLILLGVIFLGRVAVRLSRA